MHEKRGTKEQEKDAQRSLEKLQYLWRKNGLTKTNQSTIEEKHKKLPFEYSKFRSFPTVNATVKTPTKMTEANSTTSHKRRLRTRNRKYSQYYTSFNTGEKIKLRDLAALFHLPALDAQIELQMSEESFVQTCRRLGILNWPYRRVSVCFLFFFFSIGSCFLIFLF